ncbi:MAG: hypothetical protein ABR981_04065 [Candidatus Micrarchaeaceae archaeon]|jgi:hypothetical protein
MTKTISLKTKQQTKLLLLDLDDTVMFNNSALSTAAQELTGKFMPRSEVSKLARKIKRPIYYLAATKYTYLMTPNEAMLRTINAGINQKDVIILTARADSVLQNTLEMLGRHNIPYDQLIMREEKFLGVEDEIWKAEKIKEILETGNYSQIELYEDKIDNIEYFMKQFNQEQISYFHVTPQGIIPLNR